MNLINMTLAAQDPVQIVGIALLVIVILAVFVFLMLFLKFFRLWLQAKLSRADVKFSELIGMWLRKVDTTTMSLQTATAIDLAGRDILEAVQTSVNPKVIDCPDPQKSRGTIDAVAQDGIQLKAKARVTVRANIERLIGGATQETIIARVGEGIVTTIGSAITYKSVLENPDDISKSVLAKGLDAGTAYEILSIDIADVDVGENVGAQLQAAQAEADMRRAKAEAEKRRAMAVAREQEMRALVVENESKIPLAMAEAFLKGNIGIMDYYRMKNIMADTSMRDSISKPKKKE